MTRVDTWDPADVGLVAELIEWTLLCNAVQIYSADELYALTCDLADNDRVPTRATFDAALARCDADSVERVGDGYRLGPAYTGQRGGR